ncbi:hypothetical protein RVBP15_0870 [Pseudomonas phage sp. 30-1]|nr:hypothetical protein RVBP15_0870 [Pseudomonas phage sp. 30-1]
MEQLFIRVDVRWSQQFFSELKQYFNYTAKDEDDLNYLIILYIKERHNFFWTCVPDRYNDVMCSFYKSICGYPINPNIIANRFDQLYREIMNSLLQIKGIIKDIVAVKTKEGDIEGFIIHSESLPRTYPRPTNWKGVFERS